MQENGQTNLSTVSTHSQIQLIRAWIFIVSNSDLFIETNKQHQFQIQTKKKDQKLELTLQTKPTKSKLTKYKEHRIIRRKN